MEWNPTNFALWAELDEDTLPHIVAHHDVRHQAFWEHFPHRGRIVFTPEPDDTGRTTVSIWLDAPVDEEAWAAEARRLPKALSPRLFSRSPDIELGGTGLPPPLAMWKRHPAVERVQLSYIPGVEATSGLWHIMGGSELWECDVWLKPSKPSQGLIPFGEFLGRRLKSRN